MKFTVDSNYLICILQSWNTHHEATIADLERRLSQGEELHLVPHALLETYAVMTRMPDPYRKPPAMVVSLMQKNFGGYPLLRPPSDHWQLLAGLAEDGIGGGQSYNRSIAHSAHQAGMKELVTWNVKHFQSQAFPGLSIVRPIAG